MIQINNLIDSLTQLEYEYVQKYLEMALPKAEALIMTVNPKRIPDYIADLNSQIDRKSL